MPQSPDSPTFSMSRRRMLWTATGTLAAIGLAAAAEQPAQVGNFLTYLAKQSAQPIFEGTPLEILTPENNFEACQAFRNTFNYTERRLRSNVIAGFGDSNLWGDHEWPPTSTPTSVLSFIEKMVKQEYGASWKTLNFAIPGYTTDKVKTELVLGQSNIDEVLKSRLGWDILLNTGGNDFKSVMETPARAALVEELSRQPISINSLKHAPQLKEIAEDLYRVIQRFGISFHDLLTTVAATYGSDNSRRESRGKLQHIAVISAPDFSEPPKVDSSEIDGNVYHYQMQHPLVKTLTQYVSIHLNDQMASAMNRFMQEQPHIPVVALNIFDLDSTHFGPDQHWNDPGKQAIAGKYLSRIVVD